MAGRYHLLQNEKKEEKECLRNIDYFLFGCTNEHYKTIHLI